MFKPVCKLEEQEHVDDSLFKHLISIINIYNKTRLETQLYPEIYTIFKSCGSPEFPNQNFLRMDKGERMVGHPYKHTLFMYGGRRFYKYNEDNFRFNFLFISSL